MQLLNCTVAFTLRIYSYAKKPLKRKQHLTLRTIVCYNVINNIYRKAVCNMKKLIQLISLLLGLIMIFSVFSACDIGESKMTDTEGATTEAVGGSVTEGSAASETETEKFPDIEKKNYEIL